MREVVETRKRIHFVGIGGIGMSALAHVLLDQGHVVSGSDARLSTVTEGLSSRGAMIREGHTAEAVHGADLVVITSAVPKDNPELVEARRLGLAVVKRAELLGQIFNRGQGVAVAGTHGKTTTSAMIAEVFARAGLDPTFLVGGIPVNLQVNGRLGRGPHVVAEADEFDGSFLQLRPWLAVVTSVEADHPDIYPDLSSMVDAFSSFISGIRDNGFLVACYDDPRVVRLVGEAKERAGPRAIGYSLGIKTGADWVARELERNEAGGTTFTACYQGAPTGRFSLQVPGRHNVANALAAVATANLAGIEPEVIAHALGEFRGTLRRFEIKGQARGVTVVDDYAHHPTEIAATLQAARDRFGKSTIWCVFQPHTFSRTRALIDEFARAFDQADRVIVTDIYAARETDDLGVSARGIVNRMAHPDARYVGRLDDAVEILVRQLVPGDVLLTVGAGDVWKVGDEVLKRLKGDSRGRDSDTRE